jgi:spermidine export protein MdtJ
MPIRPWLFLFGAVLVEVLGLATLKSADTGSLAAMLFTYLMIGLSFYFLAKAIKTIPVALAYATWESAGLIFISLIGFWYFGEPMGMLKMAGIVFLVAGVTLVNLGSPEAGAADQVQEPR